MLRSLAWWNTGLSPTTDPTRATGKQKEVALEIIKYLTRDLKVDFLALGEVTADDLNDFVNHLDLNEYSIYDGTLKTGRLKFDTGAIFRKETFRLVDTTSLIASRGSRSLKVANRVDLIITETDEPLHIFISHWPSRLWCDKNSADRHLLGIRLRDAVDEINGIHPKPANIVLLGDYNDEPFDSSLAEQLLAVRDRRLALKNPTLLYNPFWRHLGEALPYQRNDPGDSHSGSCFHSSGLETRWRTFDQIMFSSAFIGKGEWHLNEEYTQILKFPLLPTRTSSDLDIFDHYPVISVIEKEVVNG
ncbi:endonuclease/exonuclease/phosphatase family protein [Geobacter pickeringii]|uniref:endonuclease/exonuclease/phosphatase family protein n=1 Tax=Geobacter pickeringii TaxID=345632 RepID=UPI001186016B|nr:endonuclease/exonuclease/phosphatase family protein [Geobacter pickeringii]